MIDWLICITFDLSWSAALKLMKNKEIIAGARIADFIGRWSVHMIV